MESMRGERSTAGSDMLPGVSSGNYLDPATRPQSIDDQPTVATPPPHKSFDDHHNAGLCLPHKAPHALSTNSGDTSARTWSKEEDALIVAMHSRNESWDTISRRLPGRSILACRFRYAYLRLRPEWDEQMKDSVALWYQQYKAQLWAAIAEKVDLPELEVEALAWKLGPWEIARRAAVSTPGL
ncbi:hypothetical protein FE257_006093 [Aspergillus nanangensis]|uniref:Myb-like domain-containing protein n=1 Tax=Aspergillus nanangensis TaxID=2582783 RepID=A0AAD4GM10_ASPNN|nr:hypothetical protein FE257_006093 [Aspergillus nanangensis]